MKFFHTADWHLGKLVQGVYMTEDQHHVLQQFIQAIKEEKPDAVVISGDLYDRAVPPTDAVQLLDDVLEEIVLKLHTPIIAIAGNHDSPSRLHFGRNIMKNTGFHIVGHLTKEMEPVILTDEFGKVHFHLVPYCDPSTVRNVFNDDSIRTHHDAMEKVVTHIKSRMDPSARHVFVGHAFVTPYGEESENTSESERPLSIGGAEYVSAELLTDFHYSALGHLHRAHYVFDERIRYAGSIAKYSISEEHHQKGFYIVEMDEAGTVSVDTYPLTPMRDMRTVETSLADLYTHPKSDDYVFVRLTDRTPILSPMEKVKSIYPNAMHVERTNYAFPTLSSREQTSKERTDMSDLELFHAFYKEVTGVEASQETETIFKEVLDEILIEEREATKEDETYVTQ